MRVKSVIGTDFLEIEPPLDKIKKLVRNVFIKIVDVNRNIPRFESVVFPEMAKEGKYLQSVTEEDVSVANMIEKGMAAFETNTVGPIKYLKTYDEFLYILNGGASKSLDDFFATEPFPYLKDFAKKIEKYQEIKQDIIFLRRVIPLNFMCLECGNLNDMIYDIIEELRMRICNYFIEQNHSHNRR